MNVNDLIIITISSKKNKADFRNSGWILMKFVLVEEEMNTKQNVQKGKEYCGGGWGDTLLVVVGVGDGDGGGSMLMNSIVLYLYQMKKKIYIRYLNIYLY